MTRFPVKSIGLAALGTVVLACGGSGGGGGGAGSGRTGSITSVKALYGVLLGSNVASMGADTGPRFNVTSKSGVQLSIGGVPFLGLAEKSLRNNGLSIQGGGGWQFEDSLGLYYLIVEERDGYVRMALAENADGSARCGEMDITRIDPLPAPSTLRITFDITADRLPINGSMDLTFEDDDLGVPYRAVAGYQCDAPRTDVEFNLRYTSNSVMGSAAGGLGNERASFTNVISDDASFRGNIAYRGLVGSFNGTNTLVIRIDSIEGDWIMRMDANGNCELEHPDGRIENLGKVWDL